MQDGASHLFPDRWDAYVAPIPEAERHDLITAYRKRLVGTDDEVRSLRVGRYLARISVGVGAHAFAWSGLKVDFFFFPLSTRNARILAPTPLFCLFSHRNRYHHAIISSGHSMYLLFCTFFTILGTAGRRARVDPMGRHHLRPVPVPPHQTPG